MAAGGGFARVRRGASLGGAAVPISFDQGWYAGGRGRARAFEWVGFIDLALAVRHDTVVEDAAQIGARGRTKFEQLVEGKLEALLKHIGSPFRSERQVRVSALHWPDVVWYDKTLPRLLSRNDLREWRVPIVGFEIETTAAASSIKAAINNLEALKPALGCIVVPHALANRKRRPRGTPEFMAHRYGITVKAGIEYLAGLS